VNFPGTAVQNAEFRSAAVSMVGWIPEDIFPARLHNAKLQAEEAANLTAGDSSPEAEALRTATNNLVELAQRALEKYGADLEALYLEDSGH
jgi:hypothetical protein